MGLVDRTNEIIPASQHEPLTWETKLDSGFIPAQLDVDADSDSSFVPSAWVNLSFTDSEHDSDTIKLTYSEAEKLHDRLSRILGLEQSVEWANRFAINDGYSQVMPEREARAYAKSYPLHRTLVKRTVTVPEWQVVE